MSDGEVGIEMNLREARQVLRDDFSGMNDDGIFQPEYFSDWNDEVAKAIAFILNDAICGGELPLPDQRNSMLNRFAMRNGHNAQRQDEDRDEYNLRVHGLREEDME